MAADRPLEMSVEPSFHGSLIDLREPSWVVNLLENMAELKCIDILVSRKSNRIARSYLEFDSE